MNKLVVKNSKKKGRGVFAGGSIKKGEHIETCELLIISFSEIGKLLERYIFEFDENKVALALGFGSLYNHSHHPNAFVELDVVKKKLEIFSLKEIKKGEEITIDYGYSDEDKKKFNIF